MHFLKTLTIAAAFSVAFVISAPAQTESLQLSTMSDGHTYFNRPGADLALHNAELNACLTEAGRVVSVDEALNGNAGLVGDLMVNALSHGVRPAAIENCMVVRGWRVVRLSEAEGEVLATRAAADIQTRLNEWVGLEMPHGEIVRAWTNAAASATTDRFQYRPRANGRVSISVAALGEQEIERTITEQPRVRDARRIRQNRIVAPGRGEALIVLMTRGLSFRDGIGLSLVRIDPATGLLANAESRDVANHINARVGLIAARDEGNWFAFLVPAGVWRIQNIGTLDTITFCLGAPAFEAGEGEVILAGMFDLGGNFGPDLDLEPARQWLAATPAVAEALRPARYSNGWTSECGGNAIYALEVEGAPFREGYQWGSRASVFVDVRVDEALEGASGEMAVSPPPAEEATQP